MTATAPTTSRDGSRLALGRTVDLVGLLSIYLGLLFLIPAKLTFAPLGGAGAPAQLFGLGMLGLWALLKLLNPGFAGSVRQPIRVALLVMVLAFLVADLAAMSRPMPSNEARSADQGLLIIMSWLGIFVAATDGIPSRDRLNTLLRRLVLMAGLICLLGITQFITGRPFTNYIQIPGLSVNGTHLAGLGTRGGLSRPAGTATHPIEFGAVITMCLPLAVYFGINDTTRSAARRWWPALAIATTIPISISRSAILSSVAGILIMIPMLTKVQRRIGMAVGAAGFAAMYVAVPGLVATLTGLFTGISQDDSAASRSDSYGIAFEFIKRSPFIGRGFLTFLPQYRILDNQYLGTLIDTGIFGLGSLLTLYFVGMYSTRALKRRLDSFSDRWLAQAIIASIASGGVSLALFDEFSFAMSAALPFLILGCAGALRRLTLDPQPATQPAPF
jgi:hypothetical protein